MNFITYLKDNQYSAIQHLLMQRCAFMYEYICMYVGEYVRIHICISIYIEREREREDTYFWLMDKIKIEQMYQYISQIKIKYSTWKNKSSMKAQNHSSKI